MNNKQKALALAGLGVHVFPCGTDKHPLTKEGFYDATDDLDAVAAMWDRHNEALVGVWAEPSTLEALDIDVKTRVGYYSLWNHEEACHDYDSSPVHYSTPSGGEHYIYRAPQNAPGPKAPIPGLPGVDRRSGKSYFIWYGEVPTTLEHVPAAPAWMNGGGTHFTSAGMVTPFEGDLEVWTTSLDRGVPGAQLAHINRTPESYGACKEVIGELMSLGVLNPATPGLGSVLDEVVEYYLHESPSSVPSEERPKKVADLLRWWIAKWTDEKDDGLGAVSEWAANIPPYEPPAVPLTEAPEEVPEEPTSWVEQDFEDVLNGTYVEEKASVLEREDGVFLFYPGCVNDLHGESESGKSWIALAAALQQVAAHQHVRYVDYESSRAVVVGRLILLGADKDNLRKYFHYYQPDSNPDSNNQTQRDFQHLLNAESSFTVIDGVTEAMTQSGMNHESNVDIPKWMAEVPKALSRNTGAAVVIIDHVPKSTEGSNRRFAIGAQHKLAAIDGAAYYVDVQTGIAKGKVGTLVMKVAKDRPGSVRAVSGAFGKDRLQTTAVVELDSFHPGQSTIRIKSYTEDAVLARAATSMMEQRDRVMALVQKYGVIRSVKAAEAAYEDMYGEKSGRGEMKEALEALHIDGIVDFSELPPGVTGKARPIKWINN